MKTSLHSIKFEH